MKKEKFLWAVMLRHSIWVKYSLFSALDTQIVFAMLMEGN